MIIIKNKKLHTVLFAIGMTVLGIIVYQYFFTNVKNAITIEEAVSKKGDLEIIFCRVEASTGPAWIIIGNETGLFHDNAVREQIIIEGKNQCEELIKDFFQTSNDIYCLYGNFEESRKYEDVENAGLFRVFNAKDWDVVVPISRGMTFRLFAPKTYLVPADYQ